MNKIRKSAAVLLAASLLLGMSACAANKSWAAKDDSLTVPIGSYIYDLYAAYGGASSKATDTTKAVLDQKIEGKDATAWIREKALSSVKSLFVVDRKMKELKLSLTEEESAAAKKNLDGAWSQYQSTLEGYGIAKTSFALAYSDYYAKYEKVFFATYGKGGAKAVSDDELKGFFEKNYSDFSYIAFPLYKSDSNGNASAAFTDDEKKKAKQEIDGYASKVREGSMTLQQAADAYNKAESGSASVQNLTVNLTANNEGYPDDMVKLIEGMKAGETKAGEISGGYLYMLAVKNDITKKTEEQMKTEDGRKSLLSDCKGQEFSDAITKEADAVTGVTLNEKALDSYSPSMFKSEE